MRRRLKSADAKDGITSQFHRVSSQFFGPVAEGFLRKKNSFQDVADFNDLFSKWAAIARHPEPEYQLLISYRANRSQNRKEFSSFQKRLRLGHPQLAGIWTHPEKWRELQALIEKTGFVALPTFVELGESFRHYLKDRKVLAFCPTWDRGRVLEGLSGVLSERKIREH